MYFDHVSSSAGWPYALVPIIKIDGGEPYLKKKEESKKAMILYLMKILVVNSFS